MSWFSNAYEIKYLTGMSKYWAMAASHHRLAWIHPFLDGNGRVSRLFTDCFMRAIGLKSYGLWSMSRDLLVRVSSIINILLLQIDKDKVVAMAEEDYLMMG